MTRLWLPFSHELVEFGRLRNTTYFSKRLQTIAAAAAANVTFVFVPCPTSNDGCVGQDLGHLLLLILANLRRALV